MLKALLKKQFLELNAYYFQNKKTGKNRTKAGTVAFAILFGFIFLILAGTFFALSFLLGSALLPLGSDWLYFSMMGMLSIFLGVFGSVFNTYAGLYHARDNELLLSMPIPPSKLLFVRIVGVFAMSLLYSAVVWVPASVVYWIEKTPSALSVVFCILLTFIIAMFVTALTCVLGWVVALISGKLKNKSFVTVLLSLVFICLYYFVYFRLSTMLQSIAANSEHIEKAIKNWAYPFYQMGNAATGKVLPMLVFTAFAAVLFGAVYFVLSRSFIKIATSGSTEKKAVYTEKKTEASSVKTALLRKELKRFESSATYMLNAGLGIVIMIAAAVLVLVKKDFIRQVLESFGAPDSFIAILPLIAVAIMCLTCSMDAISAPSISLEGRSIWILQSMPVAAWDVLRAKEKLHILLNTVPAVLCTVALGYVFMADVPTVLLMVVCVFLFIWLSADIGLAMNLKKPNLTWTNETVPVKQGAAIMITLFGGWALVVVLGVGCYFLRNVMSGTMYMAACTALFGIGVILLRRWLRTKGARIFETL